MSKRKDYSDGDIIENEGDDDLLEMDIMSKSKSKSKKSSRSKKISSNTTSIGTLYTNGLAENAKVLNPSQQLYMGNCKFEIKSIFTPLLSFNDYFVFVTNDLCGFINSRNIGPDQIAYTPELCVVQAFLSILYFNNIIIPCQIKILTHESSMILGECIYFEKSYEKNELVIHVCTQLISRLILNGDYYDINFCDKINKEQYSIKDSLQKYNDDIVLTDELNRVLTILFVIADHAATHYIEEYVHSQTDWIHHYKFGKDISSFITLATIFNISANINSVTSIPKVIVDTKISSDTDGVSLIEKIMNNSGIDVLPLSQIGIVNAI